MTILDALTGDQQEELLERLTHHALRKFRKCGWRRGRADEVEWAAPGGDGPADVVLEAISLVLSGQRKYDPAVYRDLEHFLRSVVDSLISHILEKAVGRKTGRMPTAVDEATGEVVDVEVASPCSDPCGVCIARETVQLVKDVVTADAEGDPLGVQILECLEAGITKPAEMGEYLDVDVKDVYKAQKRFRRKLDQTFAAEKERQR